MTRFRNALPQMEGDFFLTDGGIETTLIFLEGLDLPDFAAFDLLKDAKGEAALRKYFRTYAEIAARFGVGLILESATWRASPDWAARLGYTPEALAAANQPLGPFELRREKRSRSSNVSSASSPMDGGFSPRSGESRP
ncbi:MAG TPA: hypothetical protein VML01_00010 [Bryobacterales bacterium]|nr:hypothetical protein [Bryobacterales bacterium]